MGPAGRAPGAAGDSPAEPELLEGRVVDAGAREALVETPAGPVRVRGVVVGDRIRLRVLYRGRHSTWGQCEEVIEPSPERVEPRCTVTAVCGGCPWQSWDPGAQRAERRRRLERLLRPHTDAPVAEVLHAETDYGYRNKLLVAVGGRAGELQFGLYAPRSRDLVPTDACPVQDEAGSRVLGGIREILNAAGMEPAASGAGGRLKHLLVRVAPGTGQVGVTLVVQDWPLPEGPALGRALLGVPQVVSVWGNYSPRRLALALGPTSAPLAGRHRLEAEVAGTRYLMTPTAFFQTHTPALALLRSAVERALPPRMTHLVDLYAGVGFFSLAFASRAGQVTAVESQAAACKDLAAAARMNGFDNITVRAMDAAQARIRGPRPEVVIIDPPRGGIPGDLIERLATRTAPDRVVYVSCSPRALALDLQQFAAHGYQAKEVQPVDLFPHTPHLEAVVALARDPQCRLPRSRQAQRRARRREGVPASPEAGVQRHDPAPLRAPGSLRTPGSLLPPRQSDDG